MAYTDSYVITSIQQARFDLSRHASGNSAA